MTEKALHAIHKSDLPKIYPFIKGNLLAYLKNDLKGWACDDCFTKQIAIQSKPSQISYSKEYILAHFDEEKVCESCHDPFLFKKEEKKHWYEELGFYFESTRKYCPSCQGEINIHKSDQKRLSALLSDPEVCTKIELEEIAQIYFRMGKELKMKEFLAAARKKK